MADMLDLAPDFSLLRDMPASIMILDRDLRFVAASDLYLKTVGMGRDDLLGRHVFEAFPEEDSRRLPLERSMRLALDGQANAIERLAYAIPDPLDRSRMTQAWWRCRHNPLRGRAGRVDHVVQITENITELVRAEELKDAIAHELQHRVANLLNLVEIIARRSAGHSEGLPDFLHTFSNRLQAMSRTHAYLTGDNWDRMSIREVVARQLQHGQDGQADQISLDGPEIVLRASEAQALSMAVHELTTNSLKYGALRQVAGRLAVDWERAGESGYRFRWSESGVADISPSKRRGFGSMILETIVPAQLDGKAHRRLAAGGLQYEITVERRTLPDRS